MHANASDRRVQRERFAELLRRSMMNYLDPETGQRRPLSQRYVAHHVMKVNEQTISRWIRQETAPSPEMVEKAADFFAWSDADLETVYGLAQGEEWFGDWRIAVGFAPEFPRLGPLMHPWPERDSLGQEQTTRDSRRFFLGKEQREAARELYDSLGASQVVRTAPGHGATTLARWVHDQADQDAISRRMIPVLVSLEQIIDKSYEQLADAEKLFMIEAFGREALGRSEALNLDPTRLDSLVERADEQAMAYFGHIGPGLCAETIEAQIRLEILRSLATQPWERALPMKSMRDLFGGDSAEEIAARRRELEAALRRIPAHGPPPRGFWAGISTIAPRLGGASGLEILRDLNGWGRVRVALMLDLSATPMGRQYLGRNDGEHLTEPYMTVLKHVNKALKNIEQGAAGGPEPIMPSLLDKTFFLSTTAWSAFSAEFQAQQEQAIDFPAFRPVDLFAMLANHYPPETRENTGAPRVEVLAAVLDSEFIKLDEKTAISTEMVLLEQRLKHELASHDGIAYHLKMSPRRARKTKARAKDESSQAATPSGDETMDTVQTVAQEVRELRETMRELNAEVDRLRGAAQQKE